MTPGALHERPGIAFLGTGEAARMHSSTLAKLDPAVRRFHASRDGSRAAAFDREMEGQGHFAGYEAALADSAVDVAFVVTPPSSHLEWTLAALEAGKHVIVEKPAFLRSEDFDAVGEATRESGRRVLVAENYAYKPLVPALRRIFREELLGRVLLLQVNAMKRQPSDGWRADPGLAGGGALLEGGIHWISILTRLGPGVRRVRAAAPGYGEGKGPERTTVLMVEYDQGSVATLSYSWETHSPLRGLRTSRIFGTEGSALFESNGLFVATWGRHGGFAVPGLRDIQGYRGMLLDFLSVLRTGREPEYTLSDARRDVALVEEAYRSAGISQDPLEHGASPGAGAPAPRNGTPTRPHDRDRAHPAEETPPWNG